MKAAALSLQSAAALGRIGFQLGVDSTYLGNGLLSDTAWIGGFDGIATAHGYRKV
jgi:hypothetical protein